MCPAPKHWPGGSDAVVLPIIVFLESRRNDERSNSVAKPSDDELAGAEGAGLCAYRAAWFVPDWPRKTLGLALADPQDVLKLVTAG